MPPHSRNQRVPTAGDTPAATAASSLDRPRATSSQNLCRCSRRPTGGQPGERIRRRRARSAPRRASHRQARCIPTDGQAIRDSPNWAFATRSRTSRPPAIPRTCSCRPYIGWRLSSSAGSSEPSKEGSPANTSPTIWTSSPFASTDAHPGLAACCSTACLSRLFSVLPRQLRPFTSAPDVGNGPQSPGNHYILGSVDLR